MTKLWFEHTCMIQVDILQIQKCTVLLLLFFYRERERESAWVRACDQTRIITVNLMIIIRPPHLEQSPPRHQALCYSLFLQKPTQNISLLRIFQLHHIVLHSYQSVQCVRACVRACVRVHVLHNYAWTLVDIYIFIFLDNIFHLDVHYVCMLVQRFERQGRRFTNFHYYYYYYAVDNNKNLRMRSTESASA